MMHLVSATMYRHEYCIHHSIAVIGTMVYVPLHRLHFPLHRLAYVLADPVRKAELIKQEHAAETIIEAVCASISVLSYYIMLLQASTPQDS